MKKMLWLTLGCSVFVVSSAATVAQEKPADEKRQNLLARLDQNADGFVSPDEMPARIKEKLVQADSNQDGKLDAGELQAAMQQIRRPGQKEESAKRESKQGQRKNGDAKRAMPGQEMKGQAKRGQRGNVQDRIKQMMAKLDKDGDGKISSTEVPEKMKPRLARIDTNGDTFIDQAELSALLARAEKAGGRKGAEGRKQNSNGKMKNKRGKQERGANRQVPQQPQRPAADR